MQKIKITKENYKHYKKLKAVMDNLVTLDSLSIKMTYDDFGKNVNQIRKELNKDSTSSKLSFKEFVADVSDDDNDVMEIDHDEYEKLIGANLAMKALQLLDDKSAGQFNWSQYGIGAESIVKAYYK
jgi:hypothetical protein